MITINLTPPQLRKKKKKHLLPGGVDIPVEVVIGSAGGLLMLLIILHIFLLVTNVNKLNEHKVLKQEWANILPQKERVDSVVNQMRSLNSKHQAIAELTGGEVVYWAQKLNSISDQIPRGVWLTKIALNDEMFFIEGSAISKYQDELINVHRFTSNLGKQETFMQNLIGLDLGSIQSRTEEKLDIADFLITLKIKGKIVE